MAIEIELKAHVQDWEALRRLLFQKAEYLGNFEKEDTYWFHREIPGIPQEGPSGFPPSGLRVRKEKRNPTGGAGKVSTLISYKFKEVRDGIEINDEREFEVIPGRVFEDFLSMTGLEGRRSKRKQGWVFYREGITAELAEVEGLGWFVELEILTDNKEEETLAREKGRLLDFLADLGVGKEAIESRFYSEMLSLLDSSASSKNSKSSSSSFCSTKLESTL